jgi:helicase
MTEVIKIADSEVLLDIEEFPYAKWKFDKFNPVQSSIVSNKIYETKDNIAIAAATSAGKTVMSELFMAHEVRKNKGKALYVGPLKALAKEKELDWTDEGHHFYGLNISICTGDFRLTQRRVDELNNSDVIVMTPEMLASRCRNQESEKSHFLEQVGVIVFDESHLLTVPNRGDHIEVALMKMVEINPNVRIVLLSATMPNVDEICEWICKLTKRKTYYLESSYRPCPLNIHYECYYDGDRKYEQVEAQKVGTAIGIIEYYADDKFLVFVHTKKTGKLMVEHLKRHKIDAEFHNADLGVATRLKLEKKFKEDPNFRVLVATSTLAWGLNLPARRVIITGVHRGLTEVENYDIQQMIGRAGRPAFDPQGDAYILIPESTKKESIARLRKKTKIESQILSYVGTEDKPHYKVLAFHVVSEIYSKSITTKDGFHKWFRKSLAHFQDHSFNDKLIDSVIDQLVACFAITVENGQYKATNIGKIASIFYYSPFDVSDLRRNFKDIFDNCRENDEHAVALALGNVDSFRWGFVSRDEKEQMATFSAMIKAKYGDKYYTDSVIKHAYAYYNIIMGKYNVEAFAGLQAGLKVDSDRMMQVLKAIDSMNSRWGKQEYLNTLQKRIMHGVPEHLLNLCQIPEVAKVRAEKLWKIGVKNVDDFVAMDSQSIAKALKVTVKTANEMLKEANLLKIRASL